MKRMDEMIRRGVFKQLTKFTYSLERWDRMIGLEVFKKLIKLTYRLQTEEEDGWDDQTRGIQTIDKVHVQPGKDGIK